ncbi:MAG: hypothetical protein NXH72_09425 [Hyphomonadaceae bacterium]|nr:hypothetical protein [Hyphomonadaceae bacterium]
MMPCRFRDVAIVAIMGSFILPAHADDHAEHPLSFMFGEWVGPASGFSQQGPFSLTQTERVGPMLDGDVVVIEGRGYADSGDTVFNAFAVVSPTGADGTWEMRSYTQGRAGTFPFEVTEDGYIWSTPAGPNARMVYTASFNGDTWHQIGVYTPSAGPERQTFEMTLTRTGDSDWPAGDPVSPDLD